MTFQTKLLIVLVGIILCLCFAVYMFRMQAVNALDQGNEHKQRYDDLRDANILLEAKLVKIRDKINKQKNVDSK